MEFISYLEVVGGILAKSFIKYTTRVDMAIWRDEG